MDHYAVLMSLTQENKHRKIHFVVEFVLWLQFKQRSIQTKIDPVFNCDPQFLCARPKYSTTWFCRNRFLMLNCCYRATKIVRNSKHRICIHGGWINIFRNLDKFQLFTFGVEAKKFILLPRNRCVQIELKGIQIEKSDGFDCVFVKFQCNESVYRCKLNLFFFLFEI